MPGLEHLARPVPSPTELRRPAGGPTRVALVGTGYIAEYHLEILRGVSDLELVAVCDSDLARAQSVARRHHIPAAVGALEHLAEQRVDVVHLCTPPDTHEALTRELLELGFGVFVEKPLALSANAARALHALAKERGLRLAVNHNNVFHPAFQRLSRVLASGAIGRMEHVRVTLQVPLRQLDAGDYGHWMFRAPVNIVYEQATHPLSQVHALLGSVGSLQHGLLEQRELAAGQMFCERIVAAGSAERGTVELHLAFGRSFTRSVFEVLASDGAVEADLHHDLLWRETKTQALDFWNSYCAGAGRGLSLIASATRVLCAWFAQTLKLRGRSDAFYVGMRDSIRTFHAAYRAQTGFAGDAEHAVAVIEWCEALARGLPAAPPPLVLATPGPARAGEVVVTGANGFLGRRVVARLLERGLPVTALVRRTHGLPPELEQGLASGKLRLIQCSLTDEKRLALALQGARACIHLATGGGASWAEIEQAMIGNSARLARAAREQRLQRFVYVSSVAALYAVPGSAPEPLPDAQATDPQPQGRSLYARGKIATEAALLALEREASFGLIIARPGVVLGQGSAMQHSGLGLWVRDNHCVGWGRGETPLPVVLADDVAEALVRAALYDASDLNGQALNLAARSPLSARAIVEHLARVSGRRLRFHPRPLWQSQGIEIAKWLVKKLARRKDAFPSYRDLRARALTLPFASDLARAKLAWQPSESPDQILAELSRAYAPRARAEGLSG